MKKFILLSLLLVAFVASRSIRVGLELRTIQIYVDEQGLHYVYFKEPQAGEKILCLGEEIFKDGQKIFDNYKEND